MGFGCGSDRTRIFWSDYDPDKKLRLNFNRSILGWIRIRFYFDGRIRIRFRIISNRTRKPAFRVVPTAASARARPWTVRQPSWSKYHQFRAVRKILYWPTTVSESSTIFVNTVRISGRLQFFVANMVLISDGRLQYYMRSCSKAGHLVALDWHSWTGLLAFNLLRLIRPDEK